MQDGGAVDLGRLDERSGRVGHPVNASVRVVAIGVAGTVLHMSYQGVLPVDHIEGTVGSEFQIGRTKIQVFGNDQILPECGAETWVLINHPVLFGAEESNIVVDQNITLNFIGKVPAGYELHAGSRAHLIGFQDTGSLHVSSVACLDHAGEHPGKTCSGSMQEKVLSIVIESQTPWVGDTELRIAKNSLFLRTVAVETSIRSPLRPKSGFDVAVKKDSFTHDKSTGWIGAKSGDGMVGIVVIKAGKHDLTLVITVVSIGVTQADEATALRNVDPVMRDLEPDRYVEVIGEINLLVSLSVVIGILENDQFVLGKRVADPVVRITGHRRDPKSSLVVKGHLDGVGQVGEALFVGEQFDLVAFRHLNLTFGLRSQNVIQVTVLSILVVG